MNLMTHFRYRLAIASQKGYAKSVSFNIDPNVAGAPLPTQVASTPAIGGKETGRPPFTRRFVSGPGMAARAERAQQRRGLVDDSALTPAQLRKRYKNLRYLANRADRQRREQKRRSPEFFQ